MISLTFSTFFKNLHRLLLVSVIVFLPNLLCGGVYLAVVGPSRMSAPLLGTLIALDLLVLNHLLIAALVSGVGQDLKGETMSIGSSLQAAFSRAGPAIVLGVITLAGLVLGYTLLIVPGVILLCTWTVGFPALVEEKIGPMAALRRSGKLTRGSRLAIFSVVIIFLLACYTGFSFTMAPLMIVFDRGGGGPVFFLVAQCALLFVRSILAVLAAVIYHELRVGAEGLEIEQLGSVFE